MPDPAFTDLQRVIGNRDVVPTAADREAAKALERALPPEQQSAHTLHALERRVAQNKYNAEIDRAVDATRLRAPDGAIDSAIVKSLLYQESSFDAHAGHAGARYRGIAQIGPDEARSQGLIVSATQDDRLDPAKSIEAVPKILADYDYVTPFNRYVKQGYGQVPAGDERAKFYLAAYNGGPGTISAAMRIAAEDGRNPLEFANLLAAPGQPIESSPLYRAVDTVLRRDAPSINAHEKYAEISNYADDIVARAQAMRQSAGHEAATPAPPDIAVSGAQALPGWHISGELRDGALVESSTLLATKNRLLDSAIEGARRGELPAFAFAASQGESARTIAMQNELLDRAVAMHLPPHEREMFLAAKQLQLGEPILAAHAATGSQTESHAAIEAKNAKLQTAIVLARHGMIDRHDFSATPGVTDAVLARQNEALHAAIAANLPVEKLAEYEAGLGHRTPAPGERQQMPAQTPVGPGHVAGDKRTPLATPATPADGWQRAPAPAGTQKLLAPTLQAFERAYAAEPKDTPLHATFDQHTSTMTLSFNDALNNRFVGTVRVGETAVTPFSARDITPGRYIIDRPIVTDQLPRLPKDVPYGLAYTQIYHTDHSDGIIARDGSSHTGVGLHGGGSRLAKGGNREAAFAPHQELVPTKGCVRLHNEDALSLAHMVERGGPIAFDVRDHSSRAVTVQESVSRLRSDTGVALPAVASVMPWDGKARNGTIVRIDEDTYVQHIGQGRYMTYDVNHDLHGHAPREGQRVDIDAHGHFAAPPHEVPHHAVTSGR